MGYICVISTPGRFLKLVVYKLYGFVYYYLRSLLLGEDVAASSMVSFWVVLRVLSCNIPFFNYPDSS